jgi:hypothetical protein
MHIKCRGKRGLSKSRRKAHQRYITWLLNPITSELFPIVEKDSGQEEVSVMQVTSHEARRSMRVVRKESKHSKFDKHTEDRQKALEEHTKRIRKRIRAKGIR